VVQGRIVKAPDLASRLTPVRRRLILAAVMLESMMTGIDNSITAVALHRMQGAFSATREEITLVVTGYLVALVMCVPLAGALSVRIGRRRLLLIVVAGFITASMLVAQADSLSEIVVLRFFQGMFAAGLQPLGQATVLDTHPRDELGPALGFLGTAMVVGFAAAPTVGGYLTEEYNWRLGYFVNVPLGLSAILMIVAFVPETERAARGRLNVFGYAMLAISMAALQIMLSRGGRLDWFESAEILVLAALAAAAFWVFVVHTATSDEPFLQPAMFKDRNFVIGMVMAFGFIWLMTSFLVLFPLFLQELRGYPVVAAGEVVGIRGAASIPASIVAGLVLVRLEHRMVAAFGYALVGVAYWLISGFTPEVDYADILFAGIVFGVGSGFSFIPVNFLAFSTLEPRYRADGTSLFSLMMNAGGSIGVSTMVTKLVRDAQVSHEELAAHVTPFAAFQQHAGMPEAWSFASGPGIAALNAVVTKQALLIAYVNAFTLLACFAAVVVALAFVVRRVKPKGAVVQATGA
jgi:DHA2 family multidrug resistance protein